MPNIAGASCQQECLTALLCVAVMLACLTSKPDGSKLDMLVQAEAAARLQQQLDSSHAEVGGMSDLLAHERQVGLCISCSTCHVCACHLPIFSAACHKYCMQSTASCVTPYWVQPPAYMPPHGHLSAC